MKFFCPAIISIFSTSSHTLICCMRFFVDLANNLIKLRCVKDSINLVDSSFALVVGFVTFIAGDLG